MRIGKLRERWILWRPAAAARTARGGTLAAWDEVSRPWAEVLAQGATEAEIARGVSPVVTHRVTIRWRAGVDTRCKLTRDDRTLFVHGVTDPTGRRRELLLYCTERTS